MNNRKIAFRAWDKIKKAMLPVAYLNFGDEGLALTTTLKVAPKDIYDDERVSGESAILMQLTGLLDSKGKEIYEEDIIQMEYYPDLPTTKDKQLIRNLVVKYRGDGFSAYGKNDDQMFNVPYSLRFGGSAIKRFEIIGNIWENPDLLKP